MTLSSTMTSSPGRERVLQAALEVLEQDGLRALSMRDVARRAGVSHQAPYHHFPNREAILAALVEDGFRLLGRDVAAATGHDAVTRLLAAGRAYVQFALTHRAHFALMFRPDVVDLRRHAEALVEGQRVFTQLEGLVADLVHEGVVHQAQQAGMLAVVWAFIHGLSRLVADQSLPRPRRGSAPAGDSAVDAALAAFGTLLGRPAPHAKRTRRPRRR